MKRINIFKKKLDYIYGMCLFILPLVNINQGVDVSDAMYSLSNYLYPDKVYDTWYVSTYFSNVIGSIIVRLPFGSRLLFANLYTGLFISAISVCTYCVLKREFGSSLTFLSQVFSICFCWIPSTILYNYLTYFFFTIGVLCLYYALIKGKRWLFVIAGIALGINVWVRIPNLIQASFILVVWIWHKMNNSKLKMILYDTFLCIEGYLFGIILVFWSITREYRIKDLVMALQGILNISQSDSSYSLFRMTYDTVMAYVSSLKWIVIILVFSFVFEIIFKTGGIKYRRVKIYSYLIGIVILLRFLWGRGMFSFRYYEDYSSMYEWGMIFLFISIATVIHVFTSNKYGYEIKIYACITLICVIISPLGSNNYTYQNLNNLFLVAPFTLYVCKYFVANHIAGKENNWFVSKMTIVIILICIMIQSFGFHLAFAFKDGIRGERRNCKITMIDTLDGMWTSETRAKELTMLNKYVASAGMEEAIFWGDCPGLSYVLNIPSAISTTWPDLDSYSVDFFCKEIEYARAPIIIRKNGAEYSLTSVKLDLLYRNIYKNGYKLTYESEEYCIYEIG